MTQYKVLLSEKGQIVIPAEIRKKIQSRELLVTFEDGKIIIFPLQMEKKMSQFLKKIEQMNHRYQKKSKSEIDVLTEIEEGGA